MRKTKQAQPPKHINVVIDGVPVIVRSTTDRLKLTPEALRKIRIVIKALKKGNL